MIVVAVVVTTMKT